MERTSWTLLEHRAHGLTVSLRICSPVSSTSTSKMPSIEAGKSNVAGLPGAASSSRFVLDRPVGPPARAGQLSARALSSPGRESTSNARSFSVRSALSRKPITPPGSTSRA